MTTIYDTQIQTATGTSTGPAIYFGSDPTTGMYGDSNSIGFSIGGTNKLSIGSSSLKCADQIVTSPGTTSAPAYVCTNDLNTGIFSNPTGVNMVSNGTSRNVLSTSRNTFMNIRLATGSASNPSLTFSAEPDTGIYSSATGTVDFTVGGSDVFSIKSSSQIVSYQDIIPYKTDASIIGSTTLPYGVYGGGIAGLVRILSTSTSIGTSTFVVRCTAAITITLQLATNHGGRVLFIVNDISAGGTVTVNATSPNTINNGVTTSLTLTSRYEHIGVISDGNNIWHYI